LGKLPAGAETGGRKEQRPPFQLDPASAHFWRTTKNKHAGERGFVIGNGPSLLTSDLERLRGEVCIASNKIFLAYGETSWRPTYYTIIDDLIWSNLASGLEQYEPQVIVPSYLRRKPDLGVKVISYRHLINPSELEDWSVLPFSGDPAVGMHGGFTVTYVNLQLAVHLGLREIYLIGCDHFYSGRVGQEAGSPVEADEVQNHFIPGYVSPGEAMNPALISRMTVSYQCAQRYAEANGIRIFNATRGGHLEVFPRVDLDSLI
jgi:hypothetical protein